MGYLTMIDTAKEVALCKWSHYAGRENIMEGITQEFSRKGKIPGKKRGNRRLPLCKINLKSFYSSPRFFSSGSTLGSRPRKRL